MNILDAICYAVSCVCPDIAESEIDIHNIDISYNIILWYMYKKSCRSEKLNGLYMCWYIIISYNYMILNLKGFFLTICFLLNPKSEE